jgi:uncharacterized damage-inducible protein DinB
MIDLPDHLARLFTRDLGTFRRELELFPDDETVWRVLPGVANSAGTLALHVCGNMRHFVGAGLGESGYVRDRDAEFSRRRVSREELTREIDQTIAEVRDALSNLDPKIFDRPWPQPVGGATLPTGLFLMHLATHLAFHLGQAGYLRRVLTGVDQASGAVSPAALGG